MAEWISLTIVIFIFIMIIRYLIAIYNNVVMLKTFCDKAFANIDIILKKQADLVPQLIAITEQHLAYEKNIFVELANSRQRYLASGETDQKINSANEFEKQLNKYWLLYEKYPILSSQKSLLNLQVQLSHLEEQIADRREYFNNSVELYNTGIQLFPNLIFANLLRYKSRNILQLTKDQSL